MKQKGIYSGDKLVAALNSCLRQAQSLAPEL
jgi:hypothetical protein